jgi:ribonuclease M5
MEKIKLNRAVVVEGKYDKIKLSAIIDGVILTTNGFGIFKDEELRRLICFYAERSGLIIMTDSDGAGRKIRAHIKSIVPKRYHADIVNIHIPQIKGKEKRKSAPSKEGTLGVEGIDTKMLRALLERYCADGTADKGEPITKNDMYMLGLSGRTDSSARRESLAARLELPGGLSSSALLDLLNTLYGREELEQICGGLFEENN